MRAFFRRSPGVAAGVCMLLSAVFAFRAGAAPGPAAVINEIFYNAPDDWDALQWIELHNPGAAPLSVGGWKLSAWIQFVFADDATIPAQGFVVIARNKAAFREAYGIEAAAEFKGALKKSGERLELRDRKGDVVDAVEYDDAPPWSASADGRSSSLERICPVADGTGAANWTASSPAENVATPAGTPGAQNAGYAPKLPPVISDVRISPERPAPGTPVTVEAAVNGGTGVPTVTLLYRVAGPNRLDSEVAKVMTNTTPGRYRASFLAPDTMAVVRARVSAVDEAGTRRVFPGEHEPRPALSVLVATNIVVGKVPVAFAWTTVASAGDDRAIARRRRAGGNPQQEQFLRFLEFQVQTVANLGGLWMSLSLTQNLEVAEWNVRSAYVRSLEESVDAIMEGVNGPEQMREFERTAPQRFAALGQKMVAAATPALAPTQVAVVKAFVEENEKNLPTMNGPPSPAVFLRALVPLESDYWFLTTSSNFSMTAVGPVGKAFGAALAERAALLPRLPDLFQGRGDFQQVMEIRDRIQETLQSELKSVLDPELRRRWAKWRAAQFSPFAGRGQETPPEPPQGQHLLIVATPGGAAPELFDFVHVAPRSAGHKVHFLKDQPFRGMSVINLIYEYQDRFVFAEPLAYEVYRRVGNAACRTDFVRLWLNDEPVGLQLLVEQPNKAFLRANRIRDDGDLYKLLWYEQGVVRQHEKKTNRRGGHKQLEALVEALKSTSGDPEAQWKVIKTHFDVPQVINYFAVNMALSHWDGFFNNYFTYHDSKGSKKWTMYPWDQDKTWGFHDGLQPGDEFFDMPLTFGMEGDTGPNGERAGNGPNVGHAWWRPGGWFSAPLLANPIFRKLFLARLREILEKDYTEAVFGPRLDTYRDLLADEFRWRATVRKSNPDAAVASLEASLKSLRSHLVKRRDFLLKQPELKNAPPFDKSLLQ